MGVSIEFDDEKFETEEEIIDGGVYEIWSVYGGLHDGLADLDEMPFFLPARSSIDPTQRYTCYVDLKAQKYCFMRSADFRNTKNRLFVYSLTGEKLLAGYDVVFGKKKTATT